MTLVTDPNDHSFCVPGWEQPRDLSDAQFLSQLKREDITVALFQDASGEINDEGYLRLRAVLRSHHGPIERHEAAFIMGEVQPHLAVTELIASILRDRSVVVRHESSEALGRMQRPSDALMAHQALCDIFFCEFYQQYEHPEVLSTMQIAISELETRFPELINYRKNKKP